MIIDDLFESPQLCPECGGISFSDLILAEKKDACYYKVKASAKVWPSAYASGRLVQCRKKGADNYGNKSESINEFAPSGGDDRGPDDEEILRRLAAQWWSGTEQQMIKAQQTLEALGWEIGPDESGDDDAGVYVYRIGDHDGRDTLAFAHSELSLDEGVAGLDEAHHGSLLNPKKGQFASVIFQSQWDTDPQIDYYNNLDDAKFDTENASAHHGSVYAWNGARWVRKMSATERTGGGGYGSWEENKQGVAEGSEWETRHDEFTTVGDRATPEQINKIVSALGVATKQASSKRGFLNQIAGKQSNGDLARMAHSAETLAKNIQRNRNSKPGSDDRKELGQHLVYAVSLLKRMNGEQGVAEATGDQKFDTMMSRITAEPKYPDREMPPTSIPELIQWADQNNKPYHKFFAQWAQKHRFTNVNDALVWVGDNVDPYDEFGPKDHENDFGDLVGEPLIDAAKHNPKAAELLKVFKCYEEIVNDWDDDYRQMNLPENQLDEKSVSQAQFRTMAAAAHNPKFAKKVGISQDVAREFNKADKGQDYKDLPKKADESKSKPKEKEADYGDDYQDMVARVKKLAGLGPLKTVYDPQKRVYRNMPTAVQPKK